MRGKPRAAGPEAWPGRLIPAHAGKTCEARADRFRPRAHPRACGENHDRRNDAHHRPGSSPRMRGKQKLMGKPAILARLIPAHAGKTCSQALSQRLFRAHPRACGENQVNVASTVVGVGSSPRMRGKPHFPASPKPTLGLIPAHAGKTLPPRRRTHQRRAHPRACGENGALPPDGLNLEGSSPRMRGKPQGSRSRHREGGLIPAHAGKTLRRLSARMSMPAHPRACGENSETDESRVEGSGSSPRMRGKLNRLGA